MGASLHLRQSVARRTELISMSDMNDAKKQTIWFVVEVDVDADAASRLPGFPGADYGDSVAEPIAGIQVESEIICEELLKIVMERLPNRLKAQAVLSKVRVSAPWTAEKFAIK